MNEDSLKGQVRIRVKGEEGRGWVKAAWNKTVAWMPPEEWGPFNRFLGRV